MFVNKGFQVIKTPTPVPSFPVLLHGPFPVVLGSVGSGVGLKVGCTSKVVLLEEFLHLYLTVIFIRGLIDIWSEKQSL